MIFSGMLPGALAALLISLGLKMVFFKQSFRLPPEILYLYCILPFLAGGFYTYLAAVTACVLLLGLMRRQVLHIPCNASLAVCWILFAGYCITPFWAADKGMAVFGIVRYFPLVLLGCLLPQYTSQQRMQFLSVLPLCGAAMTLTGCLLWLFPAAKDLVTVNGRLSGFLQYPNTFAAFLLTGIAVLGAKSRPKATDYLTGAVLIAGLFLSGSRTGVLLLALLLPAIGVVHKKISPAVLIVSAAAAGILVFILTSGEKQITFLGRDIGSLFVRFLYYKDALPVVWNHPLGLGYLGYRALEGTFQTSRYTVSFVHSGFLQLMLDIGWLPALLLLFCIGKTLFSPKTTATAKLVLLVLTGHCLLDFDLQFFLFWAILLMCLDWEEGKVFFLKRNTIPTVAAALIIAAGSIWLSLGDFFFQSKRPDLTLQLTPFHTNALAAQLQKTSNIQTLDLLADSILEKNPTHSLAYSAKANAAFSRGQAEQTIRYKEKAIQCAPYTLAEYCDYLEKLYRLMELFVESGDQTSAVFCLEKILSVPEMMEAVAAKTDPLAHRTGNSTDLELPHNYQKLVDALAEANLPATS